MIVRIYGGECVVIKAMGEVDQVASVATAQRGIASNVLRVTSQLKNKRRDSAVRSGSLDPRRLGRVETCSAEPPLNLGSWARYGQTQSERRGADGLATDRRQDHLVEDASFVDVHRFIEVHKVPRLR